MVPCRSTAIHRDTPIFEVVVRRPGPADPTVLRPYPRKAVLTETRSVGVPPPPASPVAPRPPLTLLPLPLVPTVGLLLGRVQEVPPPVPSRVHGVASEPRRVGVPRNDESRVDAFTDGTVGRPTQTPEAPPPPPAQKGSGSARTRDRETNSSPELPHDPTVGT